MRSLVATVMVVALAVAGVSIAVEKTYVVSTAAIPAPAGGVASPELLVTESWAFEAGEGFAPGFIGGQAGWTVFAASSVEGHIDTANPHAGTQHLRISGDPAVSSGSLTGAFSPSVLDPVVDASSVSVWIAIGATGGADYDVIPQAPSQTFLTARVKLDFNGNIQVLDDVGAGLVFVDTGADWTPGSYVQLVVNVDPVGDTITYFYGGSQIYSSVAGVFAGTVIEQVVLASDNWQLTESGDFDDLVIDRGSVPVELQSFAIE